MTEDASAGRLYVEILADASKLRADAERKLKTALKGLQVEAKAQVTFSAVQARKALNTTLREVSKDTRVNAAQARIEFSRTQARAALNAAMRDVVRDEKLKAVKAKVDFDSTQIRRALDKALQIAIRDIEIGLKTTPLRVPIQVETDTARRKIDELTGKRTVVNIDTDARTVTAEEKIEQARRRQSRRPINVPLRVDTSALKSVGAALAGITRLPALASGVLVLGGAIVNVAGGLLSMASAASQAVGVLAVIPNLAGAAAQSIGTLVLGFGGIGEAVKAMGKAQVGAGQAAKSSAAVQAAAAEAIRSAQERLARAQEAAAERVRQARENLARAQESAAERTMSAELRLAETQTQAARQIQDAQRQVASAHENTTRALEDLSAATADAIQHQKDLALQLSGAALDEESAKLAIERAKNRLEDITGPGSTATALDKKEADLAYREALQRLKEVQNRNEQLAREKAQLDKTGIEGSKGVVDAQRRVTEAVQAEQEAREHLREVAADSARDIAKAELEVVKAKRDGAREVADAQRDLAMAQRESARDVADAQRALQQAMAKSAAGVDKTTTAVNNLNAAMDKLGPAGKAFARFVNDVLLPRFYKLRQAVQEALLPHIQKAVTKAMPLLDTLQKGLVGTAEKLGGLSEKLGGVLGSKAFNRDIAAIMDSNNKAVGNFGKALIVLLPVVARIGKVAGKVLLEPFSKWVLTMADAIAASDKLSESRIAAFLKKAGDRAKILYGIVEDVAVALGNVFKAADPSGKGLLDSLANAADRLRKWTENPQNFQRMQRFFDNTLPIMKKLGDALDRVVGFFLRLGEIGGGDTLNGLFWILDKVLDVLEGIANLPGGGAILTTLLTLSGVGLGLGLVAKGLGGILTNISKLAKYTGVGKLFDKLTKFGKDADGKTKTGKGPLGKLADEADDMGKAIDRELPKDKKKSDAVKDIGDKADVTKKKAGDLGRGVDDLGGKATINAKKSRGLSRAITTIGKRADDAKTKIGGLFGKISEKTKGKGGAVAAGAGSAAAIAAMLFGPEIMEALGIDPASVGGQAASGAITGGSIGSIFGPIGTGLGALFGGALGTVKGGGGSVKGASIGSFLGLPGLFAGGFHEKIMGELKQLAVDVQPQVGKIRDVFANLKTFVPNTLKQAWVLANQTVPGLGQIPQTVGPIIGRAKDVFANLKTQAPQILRGAWDFAVKTVPGLQPLVGSVGGIVSSVGAKFSEIRTRAPEILSNAWTTIKTNAGLALGTFRDTISSKLGQAGDAFTTLKNNATSRLSSAWETIKGGAATAFTTIRSTISTKLGQIGDSFGALKTAATSRIKETMSDIGSRLSTGLTNAKNTASTILSKIGDAFGTAKDNVGRLWAGVQDKAAAPVRWIGNNVYNRGIKSIWDKVAGLVKMSPLPSFPGFAAGGVLPGYTPGRDVMTLPAYAFSGGEAVMRPEWTRAVGSGFVNFMNRLARTGGVRAIRKFMGGGFANGGIIGRFENGGIVGALGGLLSVFAGKAKTGFADGLKNAASAVLNPLMAAVSGAIGGNPWGNLFARVPPLMAQQFLGWLAKTIEPKLGGDAAGVVKAAASMLGRGDDRGPNNNWLTRMWGMPGAPWCAMFVSEAIKQAHATKQYKGYPTAAVYGYYSRMRKVPGDTARPGDLGVWGGPSTHINVIAKNLGQGRYATIGGNENSVVRRGERQGPYAVLRPEAAHALGGIIDGVDRRVFKEKNLGWKHDWSDPLIKLLSQLSGSVATRVAQAVGQSDVLLNRDSGGPLFPGLNMVQNDTHGLEWVLTPEAVALLGGPQAVQAINSAAELHRTARPVTIPRQAHQVSATGAPITQNIFPQPRQSEYEIGMVAARKLGEMLR